MRTAAFTLLLVLVIAAPAAAQGGDPCLTADPPPVTRAAHQLRYGITPQAAGSVGATQGAVAPEDPARALAALHELRPPRRALVLRLNRLFWADGDAGIARFAALADRYAAAGLTSEIQVRYHPPEGAEGDIAAWERFVRAAVRTLGARRSVVAFSITNEANFPGSENTSDGAYEGVVDALVRGVAVAGEELTALGRPEVDVGFSMMWRWSPQSDARFWQDIGAKATPAFRHALDYVGLQVYPGLVWPPAPLPDRTAGEEVVEALTLLRSCYLPRAKLGREVGLWVSENGYATNLGRSEESQLADLTSTLTDVHRWSGELGVSDYRYFNLRDNDSDGDDLFDAVGLLRDDYSPKPAFGRLRGAIATTGTPQYTALPPGGTVGLEPRRSRVVFGVRRWRARRLSVRGRVLRGTGLNRQRACRGRVVVRVGGRVRRTRLRRDCRFRLVVRAPRRRRALVHVSFAGNVLLAPSSRARRLR